MHKYSDYVVDQKFDQHKKFVILLQKKKLYVASRYQRTYLTSEENELHPLL